MPDGWWRPTPPILQATSLPGRGPGCVGNPDGSSSCSMQEIVDAGGRADNGARHGNLVVARKADEVHAVRQDPEHKNADAGSRDAAAPPEQAGATEHNGTDDVQKQRAAHRRV